MIIKDRRDEFHDYDYEEYDDGSEYFTFEQILYTYYEDPISYDAKLDWDTSDPSDMMNDDKVQESYNKIISEIEQKVKSGKFLGYYRHTITIEGSHKGTIIPSNDWYEPDDYEEETYIEDSFYESEPMTEEEYENLWN